MNTFTLKMIALICMVINHTGLYFPGAPVWFGWIGRLAYPLFLFCMIWGYHYTRSRGRYLLRLYLMSVFMTVFGCAIDVFLPTEGGYGNHNIFLPLMLRYNREKGPGMKYFFYFFYPAHTFARFYLANFLLN